MDNDNPYDLSTGRKGMRAFTDPIRSSSQAKRVATQATGQLADLHDACRRYREWLALARKDRLEEHGVTSEPEADGLARQALAFLAEFDRLIAPHLPTGDE